eukprot:3913826-Amphidinium_carterae.1
MQRCPFLETLYICAFCSASKRAHKLYSHQVQIPEKFPEMMSQCASATSHDPTCSGMRILFTATPKTLT